MKIKYQLNNAHVCHDNVCFKIPSVLVKNLTDKVILGLPFINALYHFLVEDDEITTDPFGQKVKFEFTSKTEIDIDNIRMVDSTDTMNITFKIICEVVTRTHH